MNITLEFLKKIEACIPAIQAWKDYGFDSLDVFECVEKLKSEQKNIAATYDNENSLLWCIWLLPYCMKLNSMVKYAELVTEYVSTDDEANLQIIDYGIKLLKESLADADKEIKQGELT